MAMTPKLTGSKLHPYQLNEEELAGIGKLVRACAEMDDIINGHLCALADITEAQAIILLGRMSAAQKLKLAETFAKSKGGDAPKLHKDCFDNEDYYRVVQCRNTVAHGVLLGKDDDGNIAFLIQETAGVDGSKLHQTVNAYSGESFGILADVAEAVIPQIEEHLKLRAWREKRRTQALDPHPKALARAKQKAKPKRPRRP